MINIILAIFILCVLSSAASYSLNLFYHFYHMKTGAKATKADSISETLPLLDSSEISYTEKRNEHRQKFKRNLLILFGHAVLGAVLYLLIDVF